MFDTVDCLPIRFPVFFDLGIAAPLPFALSFSVGPVFVFVIMIEFSHHRMQRAQGVVRPSTAVSWAPGSASG